MSLTLSVKEKILHGFVVSELSGIEIGPLANPLVAKSEGDVRYVDRASTEVIKEWYKRSNVPQDKIVDVDYVWGDQSLTEATGGEEEFDYCVAAHVIEHVPDLIGWLREISTILKTGGTASFSIPDRRYTFDYFRPETIPADLLDAWFRKLRKPSVRHIFDHFSAFTEIDIEKAWQPDFDPALVQRPDNLRKAYSACLEAVEKDAYIDSHCWVFTDIMFADLLRCLSRLDLLDFQLRRFFPVERNEFEFVVQLEKISPALEPEKKYELCCESIQRSRRHRFRLELTSSRAGVAQVYYDVGNGYNEVDSVCREFAAAGERTEIVFDLPPVTLRSLRFDPAMAAVNIKIFRMEFLLFGADAVAIPFSAVRPGGNIRSSGIQGDCFYARSRMFTNDPSVEIDLPDEIRRQS